MDKFKKDDDASLFYESVKNVKPIKQDKYHLRVPKKIKKQVSDKESTIAWVPERFQLHSEDNALDAESCLHFVRAGLQRKVIQQLQRGTFNIEACLDLHQHGVEDACVAVSQFIERCLNEGYRWVLIIHGKSVNPRRGNPVLKNYVNGWLQQHPFVLAFHSAQPRDGGRGAVYILLKKRERSI